MKPLRPDQWLDSYFALVPRKHLEDDARKNAILREAARRFPASGALERRAAAVTHLQSVTNKELRRLIAFFRAQAIDACAIKGYLFTEVYGRTRDWRDVDVILRNVRSFWHVARFLWDEGYRVSQPGLLVLGAGAVAGSVHWEKPCAGESIRLDIHIASYLLNEVVPFPTGLWTRSRPAGDGLWLASPEVSLLILVAHCAKEAEIRAKDVVDLCTLIPDIREWDYLRREMARTGLRRTFARLIRLAEAPTRLPVSLPPVGGWGVRFGVNASDALWELRQIAMLKLLENLARYGFRAWLARRLGRRPLRPSARRLAFLLPLGDVVAGSQDVVDLIGSNEWATDLLGCHATGTGHVVVLAGPPSMVLLPTTVITEKEEAAASVLVSARQTGR